MRTIARLVVTTSVLLVVAACGSAGGSGDSSSPGSTSQQGSGSAESSIVSVTLHRSGGLKPIPLDRTFSVDATPPDGFTQQDVDAVIAAAGRLVDSGAPTSRLPSSVCCDRYSYTIVVTSADGTSKTFTTADGLNQAPELSALLAAMS